VTPEWHVGIFGAHSYIGTHFAKYASQYDRLRVTFIDSRGSGWNAEDFSHYDVLLNAAGIAHVTTGTKMAEQYYTVNRDLAIAVAEKAKADGVGQLIFLSSMQVYGDVKGIKHAQMISKDTIPRPTTDYGKSKLEAETAILSLQGPSFIPAILRLPMVYGPGCKGNFPRLVSLAQKLPFFPDIDNQRSMLYIENLCEFLRYCIRERLSGILFPQNREYVNTKAIVLCAAHWVKHRIILTKLFNPLLYFISPYSSLINKVFGSKIYDKSLSHPFEAYNVCSFEESMRRYFSAS